MGHIRQPMKKTALGVIDKNQRGLQVFISFLHHRMSVAPKLINISSKRNQRFRVRSILYAKLAFIETLVFDLRRCVHARMDVAII